VRLRRIRVLSNTRLGYRGTFLIGLAALDVFYGVSFMNPDSTTKLTPAYVWRDHIMPSPVYGLIWIVAGIIIGINAFMRQDRIGYGLAIAIKMGWAFLALISWISGNVHNGWVSVVIWGVFGYVTISESTRGEPLRTHEVTFIDMEDDTRG
jgi:hypothetical protein